MDLYWQKRAWMGTNKIMSMLNGVLQSKVGMDRDICNCGRASRVEQIA